MKLKSSYCFLYSIILLVFIFLIHLNKEQKHKEHLANHTQEILIEYKALYSEYKNLSYVIFHTEINRKNIIDIFKQAHKSTKKDKDIIRQKLYKELFDTYKLLHQLNIKQLHFHLPNNESFLRFHRPNKFGDNLSNIRKTVAHVNQTHEAVDSFEEGKIYNGYRYVYPLFDKNNAHIGSVEVSFSTLAFNLEFYNVFGTSTIFLTNKEIMEQKLFESEKDNYQKTVFSNYVLETKITPKNSQNIDFNKLSKKTIELINTTNKSISIYDEKSSEIFTVIPIYNKLTDTMAGLFVARTECNDMPIEQIDYYIIIFGFAFLLFFVFYFIYKNHIKRIKLDNIIQEADSGIGTIFTDGKFKSLNQVYSELLQYSESELFEMNFLDLIYHEDKELAKKAFDDAIQKGYVSKVPMRVVTKSKDIITIETSLKTSPSDDELIIIINSLEDKVQLEKLNLELQDKVNQGIEDIRHKDKILFQQSKTAAMGEMVDAIAHQWKSPLGIIKLYAQQIEYILEEDSKIDKKELLKYVHKSYLQIEHLTTTIDEFREFFRSKHKLETISLKVLIHSVLKLMKDELVKNQIQTEIEGDPSATVDLVPNEFKHVLINMINNSKDAFNEKSIQKRKISFNIIQNESSTILEIKDNAGGIPPNILKDIFKANFTTKEEGKGTGIGLYLSKQIIEKNHAKIEVKNIPNGLLFTINFIKVN